MKKKTLFLFLFQFSFLPFLTSQIYFNSSKDHIARLETVDCQIINFITPGSVSTIARFPGIYGDLAIHPDGRLFSFTVNVDADIRKSYLVEIDILNSVHKDTLLILDEQQDYRINALTIDTNGVFFFGNVLFRSFDLQTNTLRERGELRSNNFFQGDLAFLKGKLYGSTANQFGNAGRRIIEVDLLDAGRSRIISEVNIDTFCFFGMAPFFNESTNNVELLVSTGCNAGDVSRRNFLKRLNTETGVLSDYCDFNYPRPNEIFSNRAIIRGMSSEDEFRTNFQLRLDLDKDNSRGRLIDHFTIDSLCTVQFPIADQDVWVQSQNGPVDSIEIKIAKGMLNFGREVIMASENPNFTLKGVGTSKLMAINTGQVSDEEVAAFIRSVLYEITADNPQSGAREIETQLFANGQTSDVARSFIPVYVDEPIFAGEDATVNICDGRFRNLYNEIKNARPGGYWEPTLSGGGNLYSPLENKPGTFNYIVDEGGCQPDTAKVTVNVYKAPPFDIYRNSDLSTLDFFCEGDTVVWDISDQIGDLPYAWNNNLEGPIQYITESDNYILVVIDPTTNCNFDYELLAGFNNGPIFNEYEQDICSGDTINWLDQSHIIFQDTTLCETNTNLNGCETTNCLKLNVSPPAQNLSQSTSICNGEFYDFYGRDLTETGIYTQAFQTVNGCDSIITLNLNSFPNYNFQIDTLISEGEVVNLAGINFSSAGTFNIPFRTVAGCDSTYQINIDVVSSTEQINGQRAIWASNTLKIGQEKYQLRSDINSEVFIKRMVVVDALGRLQFQIKNLHLNDNQAAWQPQVPGSYWCFAELSIGSKDHIFNQKIIVTN